MVMCMYVLTAYHILWFNEKHLKIPRFRICLSLTLAVMTAARYYTLPVICLVDIYLHIIVHALFGGPLFFIQYVDTSICICKTIL